MDQNIPAQPEPHFAVAALQEENHRQRQLAADADDRAVYLRAMLLQTEAQAAHTQSLHLGEIETLKAEVEQLRRKLFQDGDAEAQDAAEDPELLTLSSDTPEALAPAQGRNGTRED
jgi:hypothetical protein